MFLYKATYFAIALPKTNFKKIIGYIPSSIPLETKFAKTSIYLPGKTFIYGLKPLSIQFFNNRDFIPGVIYRKRNGALTQNPIFLTPNNSISNFLRLTKFPIFLPAVVNININCYNLYMSSEYAAEPVN